MNASSRSYLDWNATAPVLPEAMAAVVQALQICGNPSSVHGEGRAARALVEQARIDVAALVGAEAKNVVFTSGGTEAAQAVLSPALGEAAKSVGPRRLLVSAVEHACVLTGGGFEREAMTVLPVDTDGRLLLHALDEALQSAALAGERVLLSLQVANNETGIVQPVREAADRVHAAGGLVHADAVQAAGKIALDIAVLGVDVLTLSAHKIGGPKGVGAIVFADDRLRLGVSLLRGGGQERGQRAGTENVPGIAGFGAAAKVATSRLGDLTDVRRLRDRLEMGVRARAPQAVVFSSAVLRLPNTSCLAIPDFTAETALIGFDMDGVAISSGSACSSGKVKPSHVLAAMGVADDLGRCALRISLGTTTSEADVARFLQALENRLKTIHTKSGLAA
ncbi:MAG: cysteine desulfurase [Beijerinckiaceae bacterium]|nr:cysteine desulfurase [Beijerinckiaceae bacterium]